MNTATILTILLIGTGLIALTIGLGLVLGRGRYGTNRPSIDIDFDRAKRMENKHR